MSQHSGDHLADEDQRPPMPRPLLTTLMGCWVGTLCMGTVLGYSSPAKYSLEHTFKDGLHGFDLSANDWYDPLMTIGAVLGAIVSGAWLQALGRKSMLTVISLGFMCGWTVTYLSRGNTFHIYTGRFLTGFSMGLVSLVAPCYVAEVTLPHNRGTMGGMLQMTITVGIFYAYLLGRFLAWDYLALACMIPAALLCICSMFCVESPRWHLLSGRKADALECLFQLRGARAEEECMAIEMVYVTAPLPPAHVLLAAQVNFLQQFSGINMIIFYTFNLFADAGLSIKEADCSILIATLQVFATMVAVAMMDMVTRRRLLLVSSHMCVFALIAMGAVAHVSTESEDRERDVLDRIPVLLVAFYMVGFSVGLGPVVWLLNAELVPCRGSGSLLAMVTAFNWTCAAGVTAFFEQVRDSLRLSGLGFFFSAITFIGAILVTFLLPETGRITLEELLQENLFYAVEAQPTGGRKSGKR
ncbi:LOW QUALITY PROTEIN: facilitated trehalose transporter Tret1-like [Dermacentor silvarum]|uniref:LOW QUALITY PROTEIN: facilitated trehalose transporter Tret1-like n=1 Tax=Dermacentor silvarum TaxID=543639 RepID=UPI0021010159|nr:LOW QUALITY PROTEIN: facilitated trehalose transporter Tret1-like [Dermacentor silvarum]